VHDSTARNWNIHYYTYKEYWAILQFTISSPYITERNVKFNITIPFTPCYSDSGLLGCDNVQSYWYIPTFHRKRLPPLLQQSSWGSCQVIQADCMKSCQWDTWWKDEIRVLSRPTGMVENALKENDTRKVRWLF
jgi:hypothetical protein